MGWSREVSAREPSHRGGSWVVRGRFFGAAPGEQSAEQSEEQSADLRACRPVSPASHWHVRHEPIICVDEHQGQVRREDGRWFEFSRRGQSRSCVHGERPFQVLRGFGVERHEWGAGANEGW